MELPKNITGFTDRGGPLGIGGTKGKIDKGDKISLEGEKKPITVEDFVSNEKYDIYGTPKEREKLVEDFIKKQSGGSGLAIASRLDRYAEKIQGKLSSTRLAAIAEAKKEQAQTIKELIGKKVIDFVNKSPKATEGTVAEAIMTDPDLKGLLGKSSAAVLKKSDGSSYSSWADVISEARHNAQKMPLSTPRFGAVGEKEEKFEEEWLKPQVASLIKKELGLPENSPIKGNVVVTFTTESDGSISASVIATGTGLQVGNVKPDFGQVREVAKGLLEKASTDHIDLSNVIETSIVLSY